MSSDDINCTDSLSPSSTNGFDEPEFGDRLEYGDIGDKKGTSSRENGLSGCGAIGVSERLTESGECEFELLAGECGGLILLAAIILAHGFFGLVGGLDFSSYGGAGNGTSDVFVGVGHRLSSSGSAIKFIIAKLYECDE
jgi:hypothetical protein